MLIAHLTVLLLVLIGFSSPSKFTYIHCAEATRTFYVEVLCVVYIVINFGNLQYTFIIGLILRTHIKTVSFDGLPFFIAFSTCCFEVSTKAVFLCVLC